MRISIVQNYAKRLHQKYDLSLPVNLDDLAKEYAALTYTDIPMNIDGVSAYLKVAGKRPQIFVNNDMPAKRQRFTLAHEIGHVVIPWHTGTIFDVTVINESDNNIEYWEIEKEANAFATELLMPSSWVEELVQQNSFDAAELHRQIVKTADVSDIAACLRLIQFLPKGYIFINLDQGNYVQYSARSEGTIASNLSKGELFDIDKHYAYCENSSFVETFSGVYYWFKLPTDMKLPTNDGNCDWRTILRSIFQDLSLDKPLEQRKTQQLNGVLGFANSLAKRSCPPSKERLFSACVQRLEGKSDLELLTNHPEFSKFLSAKINDLIERNS
ncbi:ImmA/IrrE family metallo-endopeptidase [Vibrio splendidus]